MLFLSIDLLLEGKIKELRQFVVEQCTSEQINELYEFLYKNIHKHPKCSDTDQYEKVLCVLSEGMYKHSLVAIPHLNFEATCIKICNVLGE